MKNSSSLRVKKNKKSLESPIQFIYIENNKYIINIEDKLNTLFQMVPNYSFPEDNYTILNSH